MRDVLWPNLALDYKQISSQYPVDIFRSIQPTDSTPATMSIATSPLANALYSDSDDKTRMSMSRKHCQPGGEMVSFDHFSKDEVVPLKDLTCWPRAVICPACMEPSITRVRVKTCTGTHLMATLLFVCTVVGAAIPYVSRTFKDVEHYCCRCNRRLVTHHFGSGTEIHVF
ncbi:hypothetical protein EDB81DRAFT_785605 [Dactylonectria macrodidyma]|uniref:LITAF domain-containing protein n=1 Tax=Dactylonectria macrodidyma TaxID=307937 RepID=A0A9P9JHM7_9HYPO|nr:hypothetical protein EDB81DRAFT_785605 [Dactylonectria macrodidyma]